MTLTEFLLARVAEDEAAVADYYEWDKYAARHASLVEDPPWTFKPARALAECKAKRQIVRRCQMILDSWEAMHGGDTSTAAFPDVSRREKFQASAHLEALGVPYSDHPDYDVGWRPTA